MILAIASASALALAAIVATLSTERARPRFEAHIGWPASFGLLAIGIALLSRQLGNIEAFAVAIIALGLGIPLASALFAWFWRGRAHGSR